MSRILLPWKVTRVSANATEVPAKLPTSTLKPATALNSVDFPQLGCPARAMTISSGLRRGIAPHLDVAGQIPGDHHPRTRDHVLHEQRPGERGARDHADPAPHEQTQSLDAFLRNFIIVKGLNRGGIAFTQLQQRQMSYFRGSRLDELSGTRDFTPRPQLTHHPCANWAAKKLRNTVEPANHKVPKTGWAVLGASQMKTGKRTRASLGMLSQKPWAARTNTC